MSDQTTKRESTAITSALLALTAIALQVIEEARKEANGDELVLEAIHLEERNLQKAIEGVYEDGEVMTRRHDARSALVGKNFTHYMLCSAIGDTATAVRSLVAAFDWKEGKNLDGKEDPSVSF